MVTTIIDIKDEKHEQTLGFGDLVIIFIIIFSVIAACAILLIFPQAEFLEVRGVLE